VVVVDTPGLASEEAEDVGVVLPGALDVVVVLEDFVPVVVEVLAPVADFGLVEEVVLLEALALDEVVLVVLDVFDLAVVVVVLSEALTAPGFRVVVVVGLAFLGSGAVQVRREEPS
jgi:hypothetical protein